MTTTIDLDPDAPHFPKRTQELAHVAAEAVRVLNYATRTDAGLIYPGEAYDLLGGLRTLTERLPQLFGQIGGFLEDEDAAGHLGETSDGPYGGNASLAVLEAVAALRRAVGDATAMTAALGAAQSAIRAVRYVGPDVDDNQADDDTDTEA